MDKIIVLELSSENTMFGGCYFATLGLPAEDYEILDAMQKLRSIGREKNIEIEVLESELLPELQNVRLDSPTIDELNFLAKRLASLSEEEQIALKGVIHQFIPEDAEGELISIKDLINSTYGLERVPLASNVTDLKGLGKLVMESDMNEDVSAVQETSRYLLDLEKIGRLQQENDGGVFIGTHYVATGQYERPQIYDGKNLPEREEPESFVFRLKLGRNPSDGIPGNESSAEWITLPMSQAEAEAIAQRYHEPSISACACYSFISSIPQITAEMFHMPDFEALNTLATFIATLPPGFVKFKAVLSAERPSEVNGALEIAKHLSEYEFSSVSGYEEDFLEEYISRNIGDGFDREWLRGMFTQDKGKELLKRLGACMTAYGVISARGRSLYELVPYREPEVKEVTAQSMTDEMLEVIELLDRRALFSNGRFAPEEIPDGLYAYDLRHSDDGNRFISVEPKVTVNHGGTVLLKEPLNFGESGYIPLTEDSVPNFIGETMTAASFLADGMEILQTGGMTIT